MEPIKLWFQDWVEACTYAQECAPDLLFLQPYSALASIAIACALVWWWNERRIKQLRSHERLAQAETKAIPTGALNRTFDKIRTAPDAPKKAA
jgi:Flp pilus assembly protein TadB